MPKDLLQFIDRVIKSGEADNRAQAVRKAIRKMREQMEINDIFEASNQIKAGLSHRGDLKQILSKKKKA